MQVKLVQATENPVKLITDVASICYGREEATYPEKLLKHLNDLGHHSTFEHVHYTFRIDGISRACLAQLTRHRHASYSVRSQRYCNEEDAEFIFSQELLDKFDMTEFNRVAKKEYKKLIDAGIKPEDARAILPQATSTDLYMSCNLRELIHIYKLRIAPGAQLEIKLLVTQMAQEVLKVSPELIQLFWETK